MNPAVSAAESEYRIEVAKLDRTPTAYIFYAGNLLSTLLRARHARFAKGGIYKPDSITLAYRAGYIERCSITQMRQAMVSEHARNFHPQERRHLVKAYNIVENGVTKTIGADDPLLRVPFYPQDEIDSLVGSGYGLVKMPMIKTLADAEDAQAFLFPDPTKPLPVLIPQLRKHFEERLVKANTAEEQQVAQTAILSCDQYTSAGQAAIAFANEQYEMSKVKGWGWSYGGDVVCYFEALGVNRLDNVQQQQADQISRLESALVNVFEKMSARDVAPKSEAEVVMTPVSVSLPAEPTEPLAATEPERTEGEIRKGDRFLAEIDGDIQEVGIVQVTAGKIRVITSDGSQSWIEREKLLELVAE